MSAFGYTKYGVAFGVAANDAGARISDKLMEATDRLAAALHILGKGKGLDNDYQWVYPFVGGTQASHSINLANPSKYRIFFEDDTTLTHDKNGVTGPGDCRLWPFEGSVDAAGDPIAATAVQCCCAFGLYNRTATNTTSQQDLLAIQTSPARAHGIVCRRSTSGDAVFWNGVNDGTGYIVVVVPNAQGFYSSMRQTTATTPGAHYCYKNGVRLGSIATGGAANPVPFDLFNGNSHNLAFVYLSKNQTVSGLPFTDAMQTSYYSIVQKFQTWCGRQV
jgi:hypothetical protein